MAPVPNLTSLPIELAQAILSSAPDASSLRSLAHSNFSFYRAFLSAKPLILRDVLKNEFPSDSAILPDALATLAAARLPLKWPGERLDFLSSFNYNNISIPETWSLQDPVALSKIRIEVQYFTKRYASTLTGNPATGIPAQNPVQLTTMESDRIERAFYRFELYCNLFRNEDNVTPRPSLWSRKDMFFGKFSPWENEQFVCVYEYLYSKVAIAFNDVASHEIEWGKRDINVNNSSYIENFLSLGLRFIHRLAEAETYEERFQILRFQLFSDTGFLEETLRERDWQNAGRTVGDLTDEERCTLLNSPFFPDPDLGPAQIWLWAYTSYDMSYLYHQPQQRSLRDQGYVFFDHSRLLAWKIFSKPFGHFVDPRQGHTREEYDDALYSHKERSRIWQLGGRGWWSKGDESKLVWPYREGAESESESVEPMDNPRFNGPEGFNTYLSYRRGPLFRRSWGPYGEYREECDEQRWRRVDFSLLDNK